MSNVSELEQKVIQLEQQIKEKESNSSGALIKTGAFIAGGITFAGLMGYLLEELINESW